MKNLNIKQKIAEILLACSNNQDIYSNIIKDFYTKGIDKPSIYIQSFGLSEIKEKDIQKKFKENKKKLVDYIKNIKSNLAIYKVLSCIYGSFLGDAIGAFCEFHASSNKNYKKIFHDPPVFQQLPGQITDDSEMAMSFAYAMMDNPLKETIDPNYLYFYYGAWSRSKPIDIGHTTIKAFSKFNFNEYHPKNKNFQNVFNEIFSNNYNSLSNGFLMRKSTFIAWFYHRFYRLVNDAFNPINDNKLLLDLYDKLKELSRIDNQCTHPNLQTNAASAIYCIMALGAINGLRANNIIDKIVNLCQDKNFIKKGEDEQYISNFILFFYQKFKSHNFEFWNSFTNSQSKDCITKTIGWYGHALKLTLYYLINFEQIDEKKRFQQIMEEICNLGGDTDTNCCIVGAVIGPLSGLQNFGSYFDKVIDVIPRNRYLFSICIMLLYVLYLNKSNRNNELIEDKHYFLRTVLTLLYDDVEINF